ncbi:MAG: serine/threonine-protein kinase, partial [Kofleriaceae bacterium]
MPTKRGRGTPSAPVRDAIEDTLRAELATESLPDSSDSSAAVKSLPTAERYRLGAELGRGGMGRVVEAFDLQLGRTVALKEVLPKGGPALARRFAREVQLTARLEHPSIVPLYDSGTTIDGRPFYVMRRVSGRPLDQVMAQAQGLGERLTLLPAVLAAIDAVAHAHRRGVIHRDLKPANILVGELGETIVIDWGLAKVIGEDDDKPGTLIAQASDSLRTQMGSVFGTPGFMAPEQARGEELDPRGDVYALGATLYQLLAGAPPHAGVSATEVIAKTGSREVTPVDVAAPGAPADLVAIVGKALAFDSAGRYADAGALGEDVRRFLAGQLVAAHRYTPRQRVTRFARRHRAPLGVAALAMVSVAVLSWISVHRIVHERDAANAARAEAAAGRAAEQVERAKAERRADQLIVMQARGLLDKNPTHAAAVLKELTDGSPRQLDARAVAQAAVVRGTAWTMPGPDELTVISELDPGGTFLLQVTRDGMIRVWDLDHRQLVVARTYASDVRAAWVGKSLLIARRHAAPQLFDPFAATLVDLPVPPMVWPIAVGGDRVAFVDDHGDATLLEVTARTTHPLWPGHKATALEIAPDGSWIALADATSVVVVDPDGHELTRHAGPVVRLVASTTGELALLAANKVTVCTLVPQPVWHELDLAAWLPAFLIDLTFRGHNLDVYVSSGKVIEWNGTRTYERLSLTGLSYRVFEAGPGLLVVPGLDAKLHFASELITGELHLPTPMTNPRYTARPGGSRIIAVGAGLIAGFDLADSVPLRLAREPGTIATFVDDDTVLLWRQQGGTWEWYDVRHKTSTTFDYDPTMIATIMDVDPADGRVLVREMTGDSALVLLRKGARDHVRLGHGPAVWGQLLPHNGLMFGIGDGRVFLASDGGAPRKLVKLDGIADGAVRLGDTGYAAVSSS